MRNTNQIRTNGPDLDFRQDRLLDAVRYARNPRIAEVLSLGVMSERRALELACLRENPLAFGRSQSVVVGKPSMGAVQLDQPMMGQPIVGKRRLATLPAAKRTTCLVAKRLTGTYRGTSQHWHLVSDRGEPVRSVVHSTQRAS